MFNPSAHSPSSNYAHLIGFYMSIVLRQSHEFHAECLLSMFVGHEVGFLLYSYCPIVCQCAYSGENVGGTIIGYWRQHLRLDLRMMPRVTNNLRPPLSLNYAECVVRFRIPEHSSLTWLCNCSKFRSRTVISLMLKPWIPFSLRQRLSPGKTAEPFTTGAEYRIQLEVAKLENSLYTIDIVVQGRSEYLVCERIRWPWILTFSLEAEGAN